MQQGSKIRRATWATGVKMMHWCPGCKEVHGYIIEGGPPQWTFDGNYDAPTFMPSMLIFVTEKNGQRETLCHYYLKAGMIEFLGDCPHELKGQTVPLPDWPYAPGTYGGIDAT